MLTANLLSEPAVVDDLSLQEAEVIPFMGEQGGLRFYQHSCEPFTDEPTRDRFAVVTAADKGEGVITLVDLEEGALVFRFQGKQLAQQTLFTLQQAPGCYIEDPLVMGKVLHACDPNMRCDMTTLSFHARRNILAGTGVPTFNQINSIGY